MTFPPIVELSSLNGSNGFAINGINDFDYLGRSVSRAGDVNGDGFDDIIIGATGVDSNGQHRSGQSYVIFGRIGGFSASFDPSSLDGTNGFAINGINAYDFSGHAVSSAGDVNGDGFDDIIISAYGADPNGQLNSGQSYVVFGRKGGLSPSLELSSLDGTNGFAINGIKAYDFSGNAVSSAGDVNGDGFDDIIIGARFASSSSHSASGQSYVVFGRSGGLSSSLDLSTLDGSNGFVINGIKRNEHLGNSVSNAGDVNGDGFDDIIIGTAFVNANNQYRSGQSYVVFGRSAFLGASFDLTSLNGSNGFALDGTNAGDFPNRSVSSAGDVNGDGFDDLIIGAYGSDPKDKFFAGQSYVVFGRSGGFSSSLDLSTLNGNNGFTINGIDFGDRSGTSVSSAGDVNGDGFDDLLIGAIGASPNGQFNSGQSYVVFGRSGGFSSSLDLSTLNGGNGFALNGIKVGDQSGSVVSSAGDVNGDGLDDILIGSNFANSNENETSSAGQSYVVFGQATLPSISLVVSPSRVQEDGTTNLVYTFARTGSLTNPLTVNYTISGTATNGTDYETLGQQITFPANAAIAQVMVNPIADTQIEPDETVTLTIASGTGYSIGQKKKAIATLLADEPLTTLSINNVTILEGQDTQAVLTVKISDPPSRLIRVNYSTTPLSATANADYTPQTGTITIAANATTATISIPIRDDDLNEPQEAFLVTLSNPVNAILNPTATSGIVTLTDTLSSDSTVTLPRAIENLKLTGNQAINGTGNAQNNILRGNSASNILTGLGGNDTYVFVADSPLGVDTIIETAPSAFFAGGRDTLAFRSTQAGIIIDLGNSNAQTIVPGNLTLKLSAGNVIENVRGGKGNDQITGNALHNRLNGGPGDDLLLGGGGKDGFTYNTQQAFLASEIGRDTLADFTPSVDKLILGKTTFTALTSDQAKGFSQASEFAVVKNDALVASSIAFIVYSSSSGSLFYNQNGTALGLGTGAEFAKLANNPTIAASDFVLVA